MSQGGPKCTKPICKLQHFRSHYRKASIKRGWKLIPLSSKTFTFTIKLIKERLYSFKRYQRSQILSTERHCDLLGAVSLWDSHSTHLRGIGAPWQQSFALSATSRGLNRRFTASHLCKQPTLTSSAVFWNYNDFHPNRTFTFCMFNIRIYHLVHWTEIKTPITLTP